MTDEMKNKCYVGIRGVYTNREHFGRTKVEEGSTRLTTFYNMKKPIDFTFQFEKSLTKRFSWIDLGSIWSNSNVKHLLFMMRG